VRYVSLFSGVEAASLAWEPLGWEPVAFAEIEPFPSAVLAHMWPDVPNLGDVTKVDWSKYRGAVDLVVGGSPCQAFSVAGKREGLMDARGQLMLEYVRAVAEIEPRWFLWENVPGVLSQDRGRAFGTLLREMDELGYGMAWRVLDAQFFGVAQRRRRVFLVGCSRGGGGAAAAVLFEPESVPGNTQTSKQKREALASDARGRAAGSGGGVTAFAQNTRTHEAQNIQPVVMASAHYNAEIGEGGGHADSHSAHRQGCACTSNGEDVFPSLCATDGDKQFIDNQSVSSGRLIIQSGDSDGGRQRQDCGGRGDVRLAQSRGGTANGCLSSNGDDVIGALCARDSKGVGSQYVNEGKVILSWGSK
jgi:DNA (cytosine-5)-methyltransferase 1